MTTIQHLTLEVPDVAAAQAFADAAFGLGPALRFRESQAPTTGFRGFTLNVLVAQPNIVDTLVEAALAAGAGVLKPVTKSFWGYGGVVQAPDGTIWKVASSSKRNSGPASRTVDDLVLLMGCADVAATKGFYVDHGLTVGKSYGRKYVEFATEGAPVKLALLGRKALAKDAGVSVEGSGSHRLVIGGDAGAFTDPDGFGWEAADVVTPEHR